MSNSRIFLEEFVFRQLVSRMNANGGANGGAGGGDDQTPEEKHRAHVREMDKLRAREQVC